MATGLLVIGVGTGCRQLQDYLGICVEVIISVMLFADGRSIAPHARARLGTSHSA